jgi:pantothenate kinase type III
MDNESLEILIRDLEEQKEKKSEKVDDKISSSSTRSEKSDLEFAIEEYDRISSVLVSSMKKCYNIFIQRKMIDPNQESFEVFYK